MCLVCAASTAVALSMGLPGFYFIIRHGIYLGLSIAVFLLCIQQSPQRIVVISAIGGIFCFFFLLATLYCGAPVKGASRWIKLWSLSFQPSEVLKPFMIVLNGWLFGRFCSHARRGSLWINGFIMALFVGILLWQPDIGSAVLVLGCWSVQFFICVISIRWIILIMGIGGITLWTCYIMLAHVRERIDRFFFVVQEDRFGKDYQMYQSLEGFASGGWFGKGPGEGLVKYTLPDAHADFIFAVCAEEFGILGCCLILLLFTIFLMRITRKLLHNKDIFVVITGVGLASLFGLQAIINIASTLNLIPTKGMPLPLISYGGSSMLGMSIALGFLLALTRRNLHKRYDAFDVRIC